MPAGKCLPALRGFIDQSPAICHMAAIRAGKGTGNFDVLDRIVVVIAQRQCDECIRAKAASAPRLRGDVQAVDGAGRSGVIASEIDGLNEECLARPTVVAARCGVAATIAKFASARLRTWSDSKSHAAALMVRTIGSQAIAALA